ncbi:MAG: metallophosphoesterase [Clostridiaceae bacterium]|nr:metallophosphoesterase [Clostridiaceae bacterium]
MRIKRDRLLAAVGRAKPDLVLFAGDLTNHEEHLPAALDLMREIRQLPALADRPCIAVAGNHDSPKAMRALKKTGWSVLSNQGIACMIQGQSWEIIGLEDLHRGRPCAKTPAREAARAGIPRERRLILAHNPDSLLTVDEEQAAYFCSGHFHGGQIWLPFHLEFRLLRKEKLPRLGFYQGRRTWGRITAYISRGLGCVQFPLRLFSFPELAVLKIKTGQDQPVQAADAKYPKHTPGSSGLN